jgi:hypothetical protein
MLNVNRAGHVCNASVIALVLLGYHAAGAHVAHVLAFRFALVAVALVAFVALARLRHAARRAP